MYLNKHNNINIPTYDSEVDSKVNDIGQIHKYYNEIIIDTPKNVIKLKHFSVLTCY